MPLAIVIIESELVVFIEVRGVVYQESDYMLQKEIMDRRIARNELLVEGETSVGEWRLSDKCHHSRHDSPSFISALFRILTLPPDERAGMDAMRSFQPKPNESVIKCRNHTGNVFTLIVNDKAYQVEARRNVIGIKRSRFINKNAYLLLFHHSQCYENRWRGLLLATSGDFSACR